MSFDIFSAEFFKYIAQSKADVNNDGKINENEYEKDGKQINENSIFDDEYKKFDMNGDNKVDSDDVELYKNSLNKSIFENLNFKLEMCNVYEYLVKNCDTNYSKYWHSLCKFLNIDQNKTEVDSNKIINDINSYYVNSQGFRLFDEKDSFDICAASIINLADTATDDLDVQKTALEKLREMVSYNSDCKMLIKDVEDNLRAIRSKYEAQLENINDEDEKNSILGQIKEIDEILNTYEE